MSDQCTQIYTKNDKKNINFVSFFYIVQQYCGVVSSLLIVAKTFFAITVTPILIHRLAIALAVVLVATFTALIYKRSVSLRY